ncbi:hemK methyltransferase family member 2 [Ctenocephalides felis]|uniref:hemK methyltransferase family member 2 n=1 Tax=Ctenocephalides felis TaxID=7515 RepID=UPI000E6E3C58|nr:hemK methyltransferase family member 2 [Ctenocephalides felis]
METPIISHISSEDFLDIYEPAEDSFILLDALEKDLEFLHLLNPSLCCEIGSGSGINITSLANTIKASSFFCTDINPKACNISKKTAEINGTNIECFNMDLLSSFRKNIFDVIIFNPPYVVTEDDEISESNISRSWAGGEKGRIIIDKMLHDLPSMLTSKGVCYLVVIAENKPSEIIKNMSLVGYDTQIVLERRIRGEFLSVLKFYKVI